MDSLFPRVWHGRGIISNLERNRYDTAMRALAVFAPLLLSVLPAMAQDGAPSPEPVIGVAAPLSDSQEILGRQVAGGVAAALDPIFLLAAGIATLAFAVTLLLREVPLAEA